MNGELRIAVIVLSVLAIGAFCTLEQAQDYVSSGTDYVFEGREAVDYVMVLDRSGSMRVGGRFAEVQAASSGFVDQLVSNDRAAIIGFDSSSATYSHLTSDVDALQSVISRMTIGDWTRYREGLSAAVAEYDSREVRNEEVLIFMSDGRPDDTDEQLQEALDAVLERGICLYTIAYADAADEVAQEYLRDMANQSVEATGCGAYFRAEEDSYDLRRIYTQIFDMTSSTEVFEVGVSVQTEPTVVLEASAHSTINNAEVFGQACFAPEVEFVITEDDRVVFSQLSTDISAETILSQGEYEYFVTVRETCGGECSFTGNAQGSFSVTEGSVACQASFDEVAAVIRDESASHVYITDEGFVPREVSTGSLVLWTNNASQEVRVVGTGSSVFESPMLRPGDSWQSGFSAGTHTYTDENELFSGRIQSTASSARRSVGADVLLVLDNSGSMAGRPLHLARNASKNLMDQLTSRDRAAVVSFSSRAFIRSLLTSNIGSLRAGLDSIRAGSSTEYVEAINTFDEVMRGSRSDSKVIMFVSDGVPTDSVGVPGIIDSLRTSLGDACLYTVGYGEEGVLAIGALNEMASVSQELNGCGLFYYASESERELSRVLGEIFSLSLIHDLDVYETSMSRVSESRYEVSARVRSAHNQIGIPSNGVSCSPPAEVFAFIDDRRFPLAHVGEDLYTAEVFVESRSPQGTIVASIVDENNPSAVLVGSSPLSLNRSPFVWWVMSALFAFVLLAWLFRARS